MGDWTEPDTSRIPEKDFPIHCRRCGHPLSGLGEARNCPSCDLRFSRRELLWMTYGPEAFADPPIAAGEIEDSVVSSTFVAGLLFGLVLVAALPLVVWLARDWLNVADLWFLLFAWFVIVASLIWLLVARRRAREYDRAPPPQMTNQQVLGTATHDPGNRTASHLPSDTHPPARE